MALQKEGISISFNQGLDTKTDPKQIAIGKFLSLKNVVRNKGGLFEKRFGFDIITTVPDSSTSIKTLNDNIVATGTSLYSYSPDTNQVINKGNIVPINLETQSLVRSASSQQSSDVAITSNNIVCTTWKDSNGSCYYQIIDGNNSNVIVNPTALQSGAATPRVFLLGNYFVVTYLVDITATTHLRYISIPILNVSNPASPVDLSTQVSSINAGYDGQVFDGQLYIAWNGSDGGGAVRITYLDRGLTQHSTVAIASHDAVYISITGDTTTSPIVWLTYYDSSNRIYAAAFSASLMSVLSSTLVASSLTLRNITSTAINNILTIFYDNIVTYSYNSVDTDFIKKITITIAGSVGSSSTILRSVGLSSKAFIFNGSTYMLVAYNGSFQPTYFLIDSSGNAIAKLSYSNGGGYPTTQILSNSIINNDSIFISYLFKSQLIPVNKTQNVSSVGGIYNPLGINLAKFTFQSKSQSLELAGVLYINGGYLRMYDGTNPVEHGFHLWPEDLGSSVATSGGGLSSQQYFYQATYEWTDALGIIHRSAPSIPLEVDNSSLVGSAVTFTGTFTSGSMTMTASSVTGLHVGQVITDTSVAGHLTAGTKITAINGTTLTLNQPTAGNSGGGGDTIQTVDTLSNTIKVPTYRITSKTGNSVVRIVLYRWSAAQQNYYQVTSISSPTLNSITTDSVSIVDNLNDAEIIGNALIYTTGGVLENIAAPACNSMTIFKNRLMLIDAEDTNLIWYSKQVIESTAVEMSDFLTMFVAPTISSAGSTGPSKCLFPMDDKLIISKKEYFYYVNGNGPDNTGANNDFSEPIFITATVGCENQDSIVFMPNGLMFQSDKGIWLLSRDLSTNYIGAPVEEFNSSTVLSSLTIPGTNQIRFTLSTGEVLMYDYYYNEWNTFAGIPSISATIYAGVHTFLNQFGQIFKENPDSYLDGSNPVLMSMTTGWINLMGLQGYERAYYFYLLGQYFSPHKLQIQIAYDYDPSIQQTSVFIPDNFSAPWGGDTLWGSSSPWGGTSNIEQFRVFLIKQKCQAFQISISEIYDSTLGVMAGAGLTFSGMNMVIGGKSKYPRIAPKYSVG